jgi:hypothetical protein
MCAMYRYPPILFFKCVQGPDGDRKLLEVQKIIYLKRSCCCVLRCLNRHHWLALENIRDILVPMINYIRKYPVCVEYCQKAA